MLSLASIKFQPKITTVHPDEAYNSREIRNRFKKTSIFNNWNMENTAYNIPYKQHSRYPYPTPYAIAYAVPIIGEQAPGEGYVLLVEMFCLYWLFNGDIIEYIFLIYRKTHSIHMRRKHIYGHRRRYSKKGKQYYTGGYIYGHGMRNNRST